MIFTETHTARDALAIINEFKTTYVLSELLFVRSNKMQTLSTKLNVISSIKNGVSKTKQTYKSLKIT